MQEKLKRTLEGLLNNKRLAKIRPLFRAIDEFFFGTAKVTIVSPRSPHILDQMDIKRYMLLVILALLPAVFSAIYFYGLRVILLIAISYICGGIVEVLFAIIRKKEIHEGFLVTGLIFPLLLPPSVPLWVAALGIIFGVFFGKEVFGGTGRNIFNPAMVGRLFLSVTFPALMTTSWQSPFTKGWGGFLHFKPDALTSATPLIIFKNSQTITSLSSLLFGQTAGSMGETFRIGIILGGLFLLFTKVANWRITFSYLISVYLFSFLGNQFWPKNFAPPLFQIFSGGLLFAAFFMATDPITSPFTDEGKWIFGILLGLFTVLIRGLSGYVEGVMFSLILMNGLSPLIDQLVLKKKYQIKKI